MKVKVFAIVTAIGLLAAGAAFASSEFHPGGIWLDTSNQPVQAHGGGILVLSNIYHWDGEDRIPGIRSAVSCYASTNLYDWTREGVALWQTNEPSYLKVNIPNDCNMKV